MFHISYQRVCNMNFAKSIMRPQTCVLVHGVLEFLLWSRYLCDVPLSKHIKLDVVRVLGDYPIPAG